MTTEYDRTKVIPDPEDLAVFPVKPDASNEERAFAYQRAQARKIMRIAFSGGALE